MGALRGYSSQAGLAALSATPNIEPRIPRTGSRIPMLAERRMGIADYTSRLAADVLKSTYLPDSRVTESQLYFRLVWGLVAIGCVVLLAGLDQPLVLLVISACVGG